MFQELKMTPEEAEALCKRREPVVLLTRVDTHPRLKKRKKENVPPPSSVPISNDEEASRQEAVGDVPLRKKARVTEEIGEEVEVLPVPNETSKDPKVGGNIVNSVCAVAPVPLVISEAPAPPSTPLAISDAPEIINKESENQAPATRGKSPPVSQEFFGIYCIMLTNELVQSEDSASRSSSPVLAGCVLWDATVLEKMKKNEDCQYEAYTSQAISKMLSKSVMSVNKQLDWRKPHILLEVVEKKIIKKCDEWSIQVAEQTWLKNSDTPLKNRLWSLDLAAHADMIEIAKEITRQSSVKTTVMLWNYVKYTFKKPETHKDKTFLGKIRLDRSPEAYPRILILHRQEIHPQRRLHIQSQLSTSELKHFHKRGVFRHTTKSELTIDGNVKNLVFNFVSTVNRQDLDKHKTPTFVRPSNAVAIREQDKSVGAVNNAQVNMNIVPASSGNPAQRTPTKSQKLNGMINVNSQPPPAIAGPSSRLLPPPSIRSEMSASKDIDDSQQAFLLSQDMQHEVEVTPESSFVALDETNKEPSQAYRLTQYINELR